LTSNTSLEGCWLRRFVRFIQNLGGGRQGETLKHRPLSLQDDFKSQFQFIIIRSPNVSIRQYNDVAGLKILELDAFLLN